MVVMLFIIGVLLIILVHLIMVDTMAWQIWLMAAVFIGVIIDWVRLRWRTFRDGDL